MADRTGVELARPGSWDLSTGPLSVTPDMLTSAAERAQAAGAGFRAPVKLGHVDARNDGEPAFGWLHNLRVEGDGDASVLLADVTGMPEWLADVAPTAYPDRSVEGLVLKAADGSVEGLEITGLALLGVTPPGMSTIATWRDLPSALGVAASAFAASFRFEAAAKVSDAAWDFEASKYSIEQLRRACLIKPIPGPSQAKDDYKLPVREPDGAVNRNAAHAAAAALAGGRGGVQASDQQKKAAATTLVSIYRDDLKEQPPPSLLDLAEIKASHKPPAEPPADPNNPKEADIMSDTLTKALRERLGVGDDVQLDDAGLLAKFDEAVDSIAAAANPDAKKADENEPKFGSPEWRAKYGIGQKKKIAASAGDDVSLSQSQYDELIMAARAGAEARVEQLKAARDTAIADAFKSGKIAAARQDHWKTQWDKDPEGTKAALDELPAVFAVEASGYAGATDSTDDDVVYASLFGQSKED